MNSLVAVLFVVAAGVLANADSKELSASDMRICRAEVGAAADSCPKYVEECKVVAIAKLKDAAVREGAILDESSVRIIELDDRWYNPSKYVWFVGEQVHANGMRYKNVKLTQKSLLPEKPCF
jgi:hypothetical protein